MEDLKTGPVLGIETATESGGVAIAKGDRLSVSFQIGLANAHSRHAASLARSALEAAGLTVRDLAGVGVSAGPGSFTGVRIGLSLAKGLCEGGNLPLATVSTLEALAFRAATALDSREDEQGRRRVCPILDARRGQVYTALYALEGSEAAVAPLIDDTVIGLEDWLARLDAETEQEIVFTGDGAEKFRQRISEALGDRARFAGAIVRRPAADAVALTAAGKIARGEALEEAALAAPRYLRDHDAKRPSAAR